jgi:hypothetical protein
MAVVAFDTLNFAKKLEKNSFSAEQAAVLVELQRESMAEVMDSQLATKADISLLDKELAIVKWVSFATFAIIAAPYVHTFFVA